MPFNPTGWAEAVEQARESDAPPDGIYDAEVISSEIVTRQADGWQWAKMTWRVIAGPHRDKQWGSMWSLEQYNADGERNQGFAITIRSLRDMEFDVDNPMYADAHQGEQNLKRGLLELEGTAHSVEVKHK